MSEDWLQRLMLGLLVRSWASNRLGQAPRIYYTVERPYGFRGITVPPLGIFIHAPERGNTELLEHELEHWRQAQRMGLLSFYLTYAQQYHGTGYACAPMEIEARQAAFDATGVPHHAYGIRPEACGR